MAMKPEQSATEEQSCPNCGISVPATAENCTCGFVFVGYEGEIGAPAIVRGGGTEPESDDDTLDLTPEDDSPTPSRPATQATARRAAARMPTASPASRAGLLMDCPSCSARISKRAPECPKCGSEPFGSCGICSARILSDAASCPECGDPDPFGAAPA